MGYPTQCTAAECDKSPLARGLCQPHYDRAKRNGSLPPRIRAGYGEERVCEVPACGIGVYALGRCRRHYDTARNGGLFGSQCAVPGCSAGVQSLKMCSRHSSRSRRYGLTPDELAVIDKLPGCQICGSDQRLHVDHDHATGAVRGVLCGACNTSLGLLQEDTARIRALADYLDSFR